MGYEHFWICCLIKIDYFEITYFSVTFNGNAYFKVLCLFLVRIYINDALSREFLKKKIIGLLEWIMKIVRFRRI